MSAASQAPASDARSHEARPALQVQDLTTTFGAGQGRVTAVDGVSFAVASGEVLGSSASPDPARASPCAR